MRITKTPRPLTVPTVRELERMFDRWFPLPVGGREIPLIETEWAPAMDFTETDSEFIVRLEAPAIHKENLDVGLEGNVLVLSGKREFRKEHESEEYIWKEREEGRFVRSLRLPKPVDPEKVTATYEDGVLSVRLLKKEPETRSRIAIK
jgi:HSP20 family protein